jgi:hypothetical protein
MMIPMMPYFRTRTKSKQSLLEHYLAEVKVLIPIPPQLQPRMLVPGLNRQLDRTRAKHQHEINAMVDLGFLRGMVIVFVPTLVNIVIDNAR